MKTAVVIPNFNGEDFLAEAIDSILAQSQENTLIVVENGSNDSSKQILESYGDTIIPLYNPVNLGFDGGVNTGIRYAFDHEFDAVALFNNDAVADRYWLEGLTEQLKDQIGITTGCMMSADHKTFDTTGDFMTVWGLPYPRGREELVTPDAYKTPELVFGATGGATLYSIPMLRQIGIFDEDFFAYYEDVDISFRAQLAGWKVRYVPKSIVYHRINGTSKRMKSGFMTYQTFKNMPMVLVKNVPKVLKKIIWPRFWIAYSTFFLSAVVRGEGWPALKGFVKFLTLLPKKSRERKKIQADMHVTPGYILDILVKDLPRNSTRLRKLRNFLWKVTGRI